MSWKHSGFSVYHGEPIRRDDKTGFESVAQYILRNPFSEEKMRYIPETSTVIYQSKMNPKTHQNFEVFEAEEFLAAITQHIPDRGFHIVRYFGWYFGA